MRPCRSQGRHKALQGFLNHFRLLLVVERIGAGKWLQADTSSCPLPLVEDAHLKVRTLEKEKGREAEEKGSKEGNR